MILVICEHDNQQLATATEHAFSAAQQLGEVTAMVVGSDCQAVAEQAAQYAAVNKVLMCDEPSCKDSVTEVIAPTLLAAIEQYKPEAVIAANSSFAKGLLPWLAAKLAIHPLSDVIDIVDKNQFKRPIYAGNAIAKVHSHQPCNVLTIRPTAFAAAEKHLDASLGHQSKGHPSNLAASIELVAYHPATVHTRLVSRQQSSNSRPDLSHAKVIVSGGRGVGSQDNFALIEKLADHLQAAVGASRAAVDAGFIANEYQVGQTGKVVAPSLYIAVGISGAIQHLAGMKDSEVIVAINKDADAPIFSVADYGLVGDLFEIIPELIDKIAATD